MDEIWELYFADSPDSSVCMFSEDTRTDVQALKLYPASNKSALFSVHPKCVYSCAACCVFALWSMSLQARKRISRQPLGTVRCWVTVRAKQRVAGLMLAKHKQTPRFHLPQVWRATRTHCVTIYGPKLWG